MSSVRKPIVNYTNPRDWEARHRAVRKEAPFLKPEGNFFIKSLRDDAKCYFHRFMEELVWGKKFPKRQGGKKTYTVTGNKVYTRHLGLISDKVPLKKPQYSAQEKEGFTNFQSFSMGTEIFFPPVFRMDTAGNLAGIIVSKEAVLLSERLLQYDQGTVKRPYDFHSLTEANNYADKVQGKILFSEDQFDLFENKICGNLKKYSEPLVRAKWLTDGTCKVFIGADTLNSRLLAKQYADSILSELKKAGRCPPGYRVPICFYIPEKPELLFKEYTEEEQELDRIEADAAYETILAAYTDRANSLAFLTGISPDNILKALNTDVFSITAQDHIPTKLPLALWLLFNGQVHLYRFLTEKLKSPFDLNMVLDKYIRKHGYDSMQPFHVLIPQCLENAAKSGNIELVRTIVERYQERAISVTDECLYDLLELGLNEIALELILSLMKFKITDGSERALELAMRLAIECGDVPRIQALISKYEDTFYPFVNLLHSYPIGNLLHSVIKNGHYDMVKFLLDKGVNIRQSEFNVTPLATAAYYGRLEIAKLLFLRGLTHQDIDDSFALNLAAACGHLEMIEYLLAQGANIYNDTKYFQCPAYYLGRTPLLAAMKAGHIDIIHYLLEQGAVFTEVEMSDEVLTFLVSQGRTEVIKLLLENGRRIDALLGKELYPIALEKGYTEICRILKAEDTQVSMPKEMEEVEKIWQDAVSRVGSNSVALKIASLFQSYANYSLFSWRFHKKLATKMARILRKHPDWDLGQCKKFMDAYLEGHRAIIHSQGIFSNLIKFVRLLETEQAVPIPHHSASLSFFKKTWGRTATLTLANLLDHLAKPFTMITQTDIEQIKNLVKNGASLSKKGADGKTLLEAAVSADLSSLPNHWKCIKAILSTAAKSYQHDAKAYNTILMSMVRHNQYGIVDQLLAGGADPNTHVRIEDKTTSCLQLAVKNGHHKMAKLLLEYGAEKNINDQAKNSCLDAAYKNKDHDMIKLLLKYDAQTVFEASTNSQNREGNLNEQTDLENHRYALVNAKRFEMMKDHILTHPAFKALREHGKNHKQAQIGLYIIQIIDAQNLQELLDALDNDPKINIPRNLSKKKQGSGPKLSQRDINYSLRDTWKSQFFSSFGIKVAQDSRSNHYAVTLKNDLLSYINSTFKVNLTQRTQILFVKKN